MTSISSLGSAATAQQQRMFAKLDLDGSGEIDRSEFTAGAPKGVSEDQAGALFDRLSGGASSMTAEDLASAFQAMSSETRGALINAQGGGHKGPPGAEDLFNTLDADGDGTVSREEFTAGRPDGVSEEESDALFSKLFGEDSDAASLEQFAAVMPPPPPPPGGMGGGRSAEESYAALDTNQDGVVSREEFLAGRPDDVTEDQAAQLFASLSGDGETLTLQEFADGMSPPPPEETADSQEDLFRQLMAMLEQGQNDGSASDYSSASLDQFLAAVQAYSQSGSGAYAAQNTQSVLGAALRV